MNWNQPLCDACWYRREPGREPARMAEVYRETECCALCGLSTRSGIYKRIDPRAVPYPAADE